MLQQQQQKVVKARMTVATIAKIMIVLIKKYLY